jgi:cytochrome c1
MFTRIRNALGFALLLALLFTIPVFAGGWAVITLDELPTNVVADEPVTIGFTVLQHGRTPLDGLYPTVTANLYKEQEFVVHAEPGDKPGYYTATFTFPKEGEWRWSIQAFTMDQPMPMLTVAPAEKVIASPSGAKTEPANLALSPTLIISGIVLLVGLIGAVIAFRSRSRQAGVLTVLSLLAGAALFIAGAGPASDVEAQAKSESEVVFTSSNSQVEYGRQLFIAKGCITCHYNSKAGSPSDYWTIEMGAPNLSNFSADPDVIFMRLKDPSSVKSDTQMPNLDLTEVEIEALVAFINSK